VPKGIRWSPQACLSAYNNAFTFSLHVFKPIGKFSFAFTSICGQWVNIIYPFHSPRHAPVHGLCGNAGQDMHNTSESTVNHCQPIETRISLTTKTGKRALQPQKYTDPSRQMAYAKASALQTPLTIGRQNQKHIQPSTTL